jgi:maltose O-acetyltransferase
MKSEKSKMLGGEWYHPGEDDLVQDRKKCQELLLELNTTRDKTQAVAQRLFGSYGAHNFINYGFKCDYGYNIFIGDHFEMNYDCVFLDVGKIRIGNHVFIGPGVHIYGVNHPTDPKLRRTGIELGQDVTIGDGVWIGGGTIILPGVTIGEGTTIGAGSVVTKDIPPFVVAVGNPCKPIKAVPSPE